MEGQDTPCGGHIVRCTSNSKTHCTNVCAITGERSQVVQLAQFLYSARPHTVRFYVFLDQCKYYACMLTVFTAVLQLPGLLGARVGASSVFCVQQQAAIRLVQLACFRSPIMHCIALVSLCIILTQQMYTMCHCIQQTHTQSGFLFKKRSYRVVDVSSILTH